VTCNVEKPLNEFWRQSSKRNGRQSECKPCMRLRTNAYHRAHREELRGPNNAQITRRRQQDPVGAILRAVKARAKQVGLEFNLTREDIVIPEFCPVLGIRVRFGLGWGRGGHDYSASVDRFDNERGYVKGNIVVVSYRANRLKSDATIAEAG
jgi:hypothetical protein